MVFGPVAVASITKPSRAHHRSSLFPASRNPQHYASDQPDSVHAPKELNDSALQTSSGLATTTSSPFHPSAQLEKHDRDHHHNNHNNTHHQGAMANILSRMFIPTAKVSRSSDHISTSHDRHPGASDASQPEPAQENKKPHGRSTKSPVSSRRKEESRPQTGKEGTSKRFECFEDGAHIHKLLPGGKREEGLLRMWRDRFGKKARDVEYHSEAQKDQMLREHDELSLLSTWVSQLDMGKRRSTGDESPGQANPITPASLAEKYGKCEEIVGRGSYGIVRISHKIDPQNSHQQRLFAIKEFRRRPQETTDRYRKRLWSEYCICSNLDHPNVVCTYDLLPNPQGGYSSVMEYCAAGDLYSLVAAAGKLEAREADCFFKQLIRGVEYIHEMGVAHRDLKPENLLLTMNGAIKITDFGTGECFRMAWETDIHMMSGVGGTDPYIAPEEWPPNVKFDPRAPDVWATGVIYMSMRMGRLLWGKSVADDDDWFSTYLDDRPTREYGPIETFVDTVSLFFFPLYHHFPSHNADINAFSHKARRQRRPLFHPGSRAQNEIDCLTSPELQMAEKGKDMRRR